MADKTIEQVCQLFGDPTQMKQRRPWFTGAGAMTEKTNHRIRRRRIMAIAYRAGHSPDEIGRVMGCPEFVVLHNLRMYANTHMDLPYDLTECELENLLRPSAETEFEST